MAKRLGKPQQFCSPDYNTRDTRWPALFLISLMKSQDLKIFAEVGVERGRLCRRILRSDYGPHIEQYWAIDWWKAFEHPTGREWQSDQKVWDDIYSKIVLQMATYSNLKVFKSYSVTASSYFPDEFFDLVFIDTDHLKEVVVKEIRAWLPKVKKGGFLSGHGFETPRSHITTKAGVEEFFGENYFYEIKPQIWLVQV